MGRVYLAEDSLLDRLVAIKFIATDAHSNTARKRFFSEARAAARITHSNVVAVYRVAEFRRQPYLVAEYVRGQSLAELTRPIGSTQIRQIANDLARGLAAAHRRGVLHRDIKPANAMLSEDGVTKLLDFGLAELLNDAGVVEKARLAGTPLYMAPELWTGADPSVRTDIFALGVLLFDLYSGRHPYDRKDGNKAGDRGARLDTLVDEPDRALCAVIERCIASEPLARFPSADALVEALEEIESLVPARLPHASPYRGLLTFDAEHRDVFFGRRSEALSIRGRLRNERFLVVAGDSGTGKSSLCRAGVLPLFTDATARTLILGRAPITVLAASLAAVIERSEEDVVTLLREDPVELARLMRATNREVVLFIDQFEELVTQASATDAALVSEALQVLVHGDAVRLLATARSDFLTRLAALPGLGEDLAAALVLLRPLAPERLFEVVVEPAAAMGVSFESEAMVEQLIADARVADGGLPLLQFALGELWDSRDIERKIIPAAALEKIGGVGGALARHADSVVGALPAPERKAARAIALSLVTPEGTRGRLDDVELVECASRYCERPNVVIEQLVKGRLLTVFEAEGGQSAYTLAHETLLSSWDALRSWMTEDGEARATQQRINRALGEWERLGKRAEQLLTVRQLRDAARLDLGLLTERAREYVRISRRSRSRRRMATWIVMLAIPTVILCVLALHKFNRLHERKVGLAEANALAALAQNVRGLYLIERTAILVAFDNGDAAAELHWKHVLITAGHADAAYALAQQRIERVLEENIDYDPARIAMARILSARAELAAEAGHQTQRDDLLRRRELFGGAPINTPVDLVVTVNNPVSSISIARYELVEGALKASPPLPLTSTIAPGSYLIEAHGSNGGVAREPIFVEPGHAVRVAIDIPKPRRGFVFIPGGSFLYGTAGEDQRAFYISEPSHRVLLDGYWIAENETTYAEYIEYLRNLPQAERKRHEPAGNRDGFLVRLQPDRDGVYRLTIGFEPKPYSVREGETLRYAGRTTNAQQNWLKLPVTGVSFDDEIAYTQWLDSSGRVPHARPCNEREWEHAARGADMRPYPQGEYLAPVSANFDATYNRVQSAFGPDVVGSHPASDSPYGVHDLAGNAWEWTTSNASPRVPVARGGCFFQVDVVARSENRSPDSPGRRDAFYGMRVCADYK